MKLWGGRFEGGPSEVFERFSGSLHFDRRLLDADVRGSQSFARELEQLAAAHPTLKDKAAAMIRQFCRFFDQDAVLFSYLLLAQHAQLKKVSEDMPNPVEVVRNVIAQAMFRREIAPGDPDVLAAMVLGVVLHVAVFKVYGRVTESLSSLSEDLAAASFRVLGI